MKVADDLPGRMRTAREEAGISQEEAAELCGITRSHYQGWESGRYPVPRLKAWGIAAVMAKATGQSESFFREVIDRELV